MWVVLVSGLGLVALLLFDLRGSLRAQEARAVEVARRDAERGARELRSALTTAEVLERLPGELRFTLEEGRLVVPPALGWLEPPEPFDPARELDAVAFDHLLRAERSAGAEARELWSSVRSDPTPRARARSWLLARIAWFAWRTGDEALRDDVLAELGELANSAPAEVGASLLTLCTRAGLAAPEWAVAALPRLAPGLSEALLARLNELGRDVGADREACERARARRATLRAVEPHVALLAAAPRDELRATPGALLLYFPGRAAGARLELEQLERLVDSLAATGLGGAPPLDLGGELVAGGEGPAVVEGLFHVQPEELRASGLGSGPTGFALLALLLASLSGGGAFLALRGARREAQAARLRSEFVTGVTHELKTPLAGIRLMADLLADSGLHDEGRREENLARLAGEAVRLSVLIDNVLDLGRLERGERGLALERTELVELTRETLALFEPLAARAGLALEFDAPEAEVWAHVDRDALRQALLNVLDNARKYGGQGGRIELRLERDAREVRLAVRDFGPGVEAHERELVFERFRRGARYRDGNLPGVGLGLYLARELLRRHAGELSCIEPAGAGVGACFELRIPVTNPGESA